MDWPSIVHLARRLCQEKQSSFGIRFGVDQATVSRWESGKQVPAVPYRDGILRLLEKGQASPPSGFGGDDLSVMSAAFAAAPAGIFLLDLDLRFVVVNARMSAITGWPVEAHLGRRLSEVQVELGRQLDPMLPPVLDGDRPAEYVEIAGWQADGSGRIPRWLCCVQSVRRKGGAVIGVCGALTELPCDRGGKVVVTIPPGVAGGDGDGGRSLIDRAFSIAAGQFAPNDHRTEPR